MAYQPITTELNVIATNRYGSQIRGAIHDALAKVDANQQESSGGGTGPDCENEFFMGGSSSGPTVAGTSYKCGKIVTTNVLINVANAVSESASIDAVDLPYPTTGGNYTGAICNIGNSGGYLAISSDGTTLQIKTDASSTIPVGKYYLTFTYMTGS